jgi:hypothetical protein
MISGPSRFAAPLDARDRIDAVADRIATDWGHHGHGAVTEMIAELYTDLAVFSCAWPEQRRRRFVLDAADTTAGELTVILDDYIYREADRPPVTEYGLTVQVEDRHHAVTAMLAALTDEHLTWSLAERIPELLLDCP